MIRVLHIAILSSLAFWLTGCNGGEEEPIWKQVKITDLAPINNNNQAEAKRLKTLNFSLYIFEIPSEDIGILEEVWPKLYTHPLRFNDAGAFGGNLFIAGFGQVPMWGIIADLLRSVDGIQAGTVSLLLPDGQSNDVAIAVLGSEQTVFYVSKNVLMKKVKLGPGQISLRIQAEKMPGSRGVCRVSVLPVFSPPRRISIPLLASRDKSGEFPFTSAGFNLSMSIGDFVLIGPDEYDGSQTSLGSLILSKPEGSLFFNELERKAPELKPSVRLFLLVCTGVNY